MYCHTLSMTGKRQNNDHFQQFSSKANPEIVFSFCKKSVLLSPGYCIYQGIFL